MADGPYKHGLREHVVRRVETVTGWIDAAVQQVLILVMAAIFLLMMAQVLLRYVIYAPLLWIEEVAAYMLPVLALWGAAVCLRHNAHIKVDFILEAMPRRLKQLMKAAIHLLIFYLALKLVQAGVALIELGRNELATSQAFSLFWPRLSIVVGGVLIMIQSASLILKELLGPEAPDRARSAGGR